MADDNKDELCAKVHYLKDNQKLSLRQIAKELNMSRDKVSAPRSAKGASEMKRSPPQSCSKQG